MFRLFWLFVSLGLISCSSVDTQLPKPIELDKMLMAQPATKVWSKDGEGSDGWRSQWLGEKLSLVNKEGKLVQYTFPALAPPSAWSITSSLASPLAYRDKFLVWVSTDNQLVAYQDNVEKWRYPLSASSLTKPLIAGERVFVFLLDRSLLAFDLDEGYLLWKLQPSKESLILNEPGYLGIADHKLIWGNNGKVFGIDADKGKIVWAVSLAPLRAVSEIEKLADILQAGSKFGNNICVQAFMSQVACIDARTGKLLWSKAFLGYQGVLGNELVVFSVSHQGIVMAWNRFTGDKIWENDRLRYRTLRSSLLMKNKLIVTDDSGVLYILSAEDGRLLNYFSTGYRGKLDLLEVPDNIDISQCPRLGNRFILTSSNGDVSVWCLH
ncbi:MAG: PQQ-binding-like beta-propeller repeat protein [Gammaproteobacteria bacterium]|nr:PQQ-binding-like beta-propeller repeat protein [Gammaproteobacteria bacterium]